MGYLGYKPADKPLTSADITDGIITTTKIADSNITSAKITDATIVNGDIANATIALSKLSATGTPSAATFLRGDNSWGSAGATAGQVIQVLTATDSTDRSTTSADFATASNTLSVTITPSSSSNKIFVITTGNIAISGDNVAFATIYRGSTNIGNVDWGMLRCGGVSFTIPLSMSRLDSPATTSAITYQVRFKSFTGSGTTTINNNSTQSSITCFEIKG